MPPIPAPLKRRVYTEEEVARKNKAKVDARRKNEDNRRKDDAT